MRKMTQQLWRQPATLPVWNVLQQRFFCLSVPLRFDIKKYEMEKRRRRELERAGIDEDDDAPWVAPEEQERIDQEAEMRAKEEAERVQQMLERRAKEDIEKRKKFREFRAQQLAMSRNRKAANATVKQSTRGAGRVVEEFVNDASDDPSSSSPSPGDDSLPGGDGRDGATDQHR
ncbi:hypothetical protein TRVL_00456 [Trypanosoma vivax]|nr:hypothetical protein TRVL_00456 [Trypanosoma vivax]